MESRWREWRYFERLWDEFESKGWELGPVKYVDLPPVCAEFGPYRIVFRYRELGTDESLFEVREMHEGEECEVVLVWGVPTPYQAQELLEEYGVEQLRDLSDGAIDTAQAHGPRSYPEGLWEGLLPPMVYAERFAKQAVDN